MPKFITSDRHSNRLCLSAEIQLQGSPSKFQCNRCFANLVLCIVMKGHNRCVECTCHGKPCVGILWESLDHARAKIQSDIEAAEQEQSRHLAEMNRLASKLARLRKTFQQTQDHAKQKTLCLAQELADDNDGTENDNPQMLSQFLDQMPIDAWQSVSSPPQTAAASSHSSWGLLLVPKLTLRYCTPSTWQDSGLPH